MKNGKEFIPGVALMHKLADSAVPPKASKQRIQEAPAGGKNRIDKKNIPDNGILLLKINLTVS